MYKLTDDDIKVISFPLIKLAKKLKETVKKLKTCTET